MEVIEKLILENEDKEAKRKLKLADYLYREIENDENAEQLEELVSLLVEVLGGDNSVKKSASRQFESEVMDAFYRYLLNSGKTEKTSYDYCMRLVGIFKSLGISIEDMFNGRADVQGIIDLYSKGGDRYDENVQRHNGPSSALKQFKKFLCDIERYPGGTPKDPTLIPPVHDDDDK